MRPAVIGVSLKMYFGHPRALDWLAAVADIATRQLSGRDGLGVPHPHVEFFVLPTYLQILPALAAFAGTPARVGAQDLAVEDSGAFTGEVSGTELAEIGVEYVEVGHSERRELFAEGDEVVAAKTAAALRNKLVPVLCLGECNRGDPMRAGIQVVRQLHSALMNAPAGRVIVAYEPVWAIGASRPASIDHIRAVACALRSALDDLPGRAGSSIIYGGSAGPGLLGKIFDDVDGVFLGRFAHDPFALESILQEARTQPRR